MGRHSTAHQPALVLTDGDNNLPELGIRLQISMGFDNAVEWEGLGDNRL